MFENLFVFEMANNHQGSVDHGLKIIEKMGYIKKKYNINAAVKFQFRDIDTFVHKNAMKEADKNDKIKRFLTTKLSMDEFKVLINKVREYDMWVMCTPFDEASVERVIKEKYDILRKEAMAMVDGKKEGVFLIE